MKVLVAYDGSLSAKTALSYGIEKIREKGGGIVMLSIFHSSMFVDYDGHPSAMEIARAEWKRGLEEGEKALRESGLAFRVIEAEGVPEEEILGYAESEKPDVLLAPSRYRSAAGKARCPVVSIPGEIIVPVDNTDSSIKSLPIIIREAKATGSKVIVLGIVPIHIYGLDERAEIEGVRKETSTSVKRLKKALNDEGIKAEELTREGYPDEEILKVAESRPGSLVMIPGAREMPSELGKAAGILMDEPERLRGLVLLSPA